MTPRQKTTAEIIKATEIQVKAVELRKQHKNYRQIAAELGISVGNAHKYVTQYIDENRRITAEKAEQLRDIEVQRLDALCDSLWTKATRGDARSAEVLLRAMESRRRLLGLDAPAASAVVVDSRPETVRALMALATGTTVDAVDVTPKDDG
jgi:uncharacterized protein YoaH (UPF0181 family)